MQAWPQRPGVFDRRHAPSPHLAGQLSPLEALRPLPCLSCADLCFLCFS